MRTKQAFRLCCLVFAVMTAAGGCKAPGVSSAGMTVESYPSTHIRLNSKFFSGWFQFVEYAAAKTDGLLHATVRVQNRKGGDVQFEYRFRWLDKNGIEVRTPLSVWRQAAAGGKEQALLTGIAPDRRVDDFILDVRFSFPSTRY